MSTFDERRVDGAAARLYVERGYQGCVGAIRTLNYMGAEVVVYDRKMERLEYIEKFEPLKNGKRRHFMNNLSE